MPQSLALEVLCSHVVVNTPLLLDPVVARVCLPLRRSLQCQLKLRLTQLSSDGRAGVDWLEVETERALVAHLLEAAGGAARTYAHSKECVARASALLSDMDPSLAGKVFRRMYPWFYSGENLIDMYKDFIGRVIGRMTMLSFSKLVARVDIQIVPDLVIPDLMPKLGGIFWRLSDADLTQILGHTKPEHLNSVAICVYCFPMNRLLAICEHIARLFSKEVADRVLSEIRWHRDIESEDLPDWEDYDPADPLSDDEEVVFGAFDKDHCYVNKKMMGIIRAKMSEGVSPSEADLAKLFDIRAQSENAVFSRIYMPSICCHIVFKALADKKLFPLELACCAHPDIVAKSIICELGVAKAAATFLRAAESIRADVTSEGLNPRVLDSTFSKCRRRNPSLLRLLKSF